MPNATVRANARTTPKPKPGSAASIRRQTADLKSATALLKAGRKREGERARKLVAMAEADFEPLSSDILKVVKPPSNDVWLGHLVGFRCATIVLGKTKDELKDMAQEEEVLVLLDQLSVSGDYLKAVAHRGIYSRDKKSPAAQEGDPTAGLGLGALALWGRLSAPDNQTRQIGAVKTNGRRVAPTAGLRCGASGQATRRLAAEDLPVLRSATMS